MDVEVAKDKAQEIGAEEIIVEHIIKKGWMDCFLDVHELNSYINGLQKGIEPLTACIVFKKSDDLGSV